MNNLTENHFSFKCPMNWDEMEVSGNGRNCQKCRKQVFDLTNCSIDEVIALQQKHGAICGSIRLAQAAAVALSLSAAACQEAQPGRTTGKPVTSGYGDSKTPVRLGMICPPDELEKMKGQ
jgi:hypothetical protein